MTLTFRSATFSDAAALADVYLTSRKVCLPYAPLARTDAEVRQWIADEVIPSGRVTVALDGTAVVGMMALAPGRPINWISHLYVHPHCTGYGIGTHLQSLAKDELGSPIRLYTFQANTGARRLYERHGSQPILFGDGSGNEEGCPDVLYEFVGDPIPGASALARLIAIYLSPTATVAPVPVNEAVAQARRGLVGDRYHTGSGTFSNSEPKGPGRELTLIESEVLASLELEVGITLTAAEARRNLVTEGVRLNELLGVKFRIGDVLVEGIRLCEPCTHLDGVTGLPLLKPLAGRGGLRATILADGVMRVGDTIERA